MGVGDFKTTTTTTIITGSLLEYKYRGSDKYNHFEYGAERIIHIINTDRCLFPDKEKSLI